MNNSYHFIFDSKSKPSSLLMRRNIQGLSIPVDSISHSNILKTFSELENEKKINISIEEFKLSYQLPEHLTWVKLEDIDSLPENQGAYLCQALGYFWSEFSSHATEEHRSLPHFINKVNPKKEVFIYGGSFNPWHKGHEVCINQCPTENVIVVPDFNPWKSKSTHFLTPCRWESFKMLAMSYKSRGFSFYPGFWGRSTPNPTSSWLPNLNYKKVSLVMGDDNFTSLDRWQNLDVIINAVHKIYVIPRHFSTFKLNQKKNEFEHLYHKRIFEIMKNHEFQNISSTHIRKFNQLIY